MDVIQLETIIAKSLDDGQFCLSISELSSSSVNEVSKDFLPHNTIKLDDAKIVESSDRNSIIIRGQGVDFPFKEMESEIHFYLQDNEAAFKFIATADTDWTLDVGFPPFRGTLISKIKFLSPPQLRLFSHDTEGIPKGMSFEGTIDLNAMTGGLASLAGRDRQVISGSIILKENGSKLYSVDLVAPVSQQVDLGIATVEELTFKVTNRLGYNPRRKNYFAIPYIQLGANIPFPSQGEKRKIPVAVEIINLESDIRFRADLTDGIDAALDEIKSLTNQVSLEELLPDEDFELQKVLKLNEFFFDINTSNPNKVTFIGVGIQSTSPWKILHLEASNKDLVIQNVALDFRLYDPFGSKNTRMMVSGEVAIGNEAVLMVSTYYPEWFIQGYLKEDTHLSLTEIFEEFLGSGADVPEMGVYELDFELSAGNYALKVDLEGYWNISDTFVSLEAVRLSIEHETENGTQAYIAGRFDIADLGIIVTADYPGNDAGWQFEGNTGYGQEIPIGNLIEDIADLFGDVTLPSAIETLTIKNLGISFNTKTKDFLFTCESKCTIEEREVDLILAIDITHPTKNTSHYQFSGYFILDTLQIDLIFSKDVNAKTLIGRISRVNLSQLTEQLINSASFTTDLPDFELETVEISLNPSTGELSFSSESTETWQIPIGVNGLEIEDVALTVNRTVTQDKKKATTGIIGGILEIGSTSFPVTYNFPGDFVLKGNVSSFSLSPLIRYLCGDKILKRTPIPASIIALSFSDIDITIAPQAKTFSLAAAQSPLGKLEFLVQKMPDGDWGFTTGFIPPSTWKFSQIADELSVLDGLKFSNTALILSSDQNRNLSLTTLETPRSDISVIRGLNFFANLDLSGLGVDELLGITSLNVYTAISGKPTDIVLEASIDGEFELSDTVAFGDIKFRLQPSPSNFSLTLLGALTVIMNDSQLQFIGGMEVEPRGAVLQATMSGIWNEPFNTKGVAIANVALDLGVSFAPLLPTIGIAGTLKIGDFEGVMAAKFDSAMPSRSMLAIEFNRLHLMDVIRTFCGATVTNAIPDKLAETVLNIGYENVKIYIVPQDTQIGELYFEQGFRLEGTMIFWGLRAYGYMNIDYLEGTEIRGEVEPINLGGIFKLTGVGNKPKPSLYLKASPQKPPNLDISGAVELLGLRSETQLSFSEKGFDFVTSGQIFKKFECTIEARGKDFTKGGDFWVKATLKNDLFVYLREKATEAIEKATESVVKDLSNAQKDINRAQKEVNKLNKNIEDMRRQVNSEREQDTKRLQAAQRDVKKAEDEVNKLEQDIRNSHNKIKELERDIKDKKRWVDRAPWHKKASRGTQYAAYAAAKGAEITGIYSKIGGLEAAKATAIGALKVAREVLKGIEVGTKAFPVDADPRIAGLFAARETANGVLEAAELFLEGLKQTMGAMAEVGQFIIDVGLGGILDIRAASFEGSLSATQGGSVALSITVVFMNQNPETLSLDFNFHDPLSGANALAKKLLPN